MLVILCVETNGKVVHHYITETLQIQTISRAHSYSDYNFFKFITFLSFVQFHSNFHQLIYFSDLSAFL